MAERWAHPRLEVPRAMSEARGRRWQSQCGRVVKCVAEMGELCLLHTLTHLPTVAMNLANEVEMRRGSRKTAQYVDVKGPKHASQAEGQGKKRAFHVLVRGITTRLPRSCSYPSIGFDTEHPPLNMR